MPDLTQQIRRFAKQQSFRLFDSQSWSTKLGGFAAAASVRTWMSTLRYRAIFHDPTVDPVRTDFRGPVIGIFWHEYLTVLFYLRGNTNTAILTSRHRDANWLSEAARYMGFETIRGSTNRGGSQALLEMMRNHRDKNLGIACDGPRGPRREMAAGPIYLSSKLQIPLVTYGIGFDRPWRMKTWDSFAIARPFSRARLVVGQRIQVPADADRTTIEAYRRQVQQQLNELTEEAESWAHSGQ
ncbi:MAG: lysophospholipid acyltransferase family protein, partial [Pirellulaceae bacterium]